jgi:RNA polymerase sigma-70 factor (ECF subfamily)
MYEPGRQQAVSRSGRFPDTRWSLVAAAGDSQHPHGRDAMEDLCRLYWYPVYAFIRRGGANTDTAEDRTQGFFSHLLEKKTWRSADPERGRFRSFLLGALKRYVLDERDRATALKRGGDREILPLNLSGFEQRYRLESKTDDSPERTFARRWALETLERALAVLWQELERSADPERSRRLAACLTGNGDTTPYRQLAVELGMTEPAVRVAIHRLRKRFGTILRREVARTVTDPRSVDDELRYLFSCLGR